MDSKSSFQLSLFEEPLRIERLERLYTVIDRLVERHGRGILFHASSFDAYFQKQHEGERGTIPSRKTTPLKGETLRRRLGILILK